VARRLAPGFRIGASFKARFNADATQLATLGKRITLWDVAARARIATGPPLQQAAAVDFSPDGRLLAAKNTSGQILVMAVPDLDERARFSGRGFGEGTDIFFAPDGRHLVDGTWSGLLTVRDALTGDIVWQETGADIFTLACTRDRRTWLYHRTGGDVVLRGWPFGDTPPEPVVSLQHVGPMALSDDARRIAFLKRGLTILQRGTAWEVAAQLDVVPIGGTGQAMSWSPDGTLLAYTAERHATIFDAELRPLHREDLRYVSDADFAPTGTLVAFGDWSAGLVLAWPQAGTTST